MTGSAMALNDYCDREIDAVNQPERPIPSGEVEPWEALALMAVLSLLGLLLAWRTNLGCLFMAAFSWLVMALYSTVGKATGLPGNMMVSTCVSIPFLYGALASGVGLPPRSLLFASMAFLSNTGREVAKGIADVEGDRRRGVRTIAVSRGAGVAAQVSALFLLSALLLSPLPPLLGLVSAWYLPPVVATDLMLLYASYSLIRGPTRENSLRVKGLILASMALGLLAFLLGSLLGSPGG
jgi:geranylgeranylglycerol-phosphate geranylgeranyltransferase